MFPLYNKRNPQYKKRSLFSSTSSLLALLLLVILSIALSGCNVLNHESGALEGVVHRQIIDSAATAPLSNVLVVASGSTNSVFTDQNGHFLLNEIPAGIKTISFIKEGYNVLRLVNVSIEPNTVNTINSGGLIILQPMDDTALFNTALDFLEQEKYDLALGTFQELLITFPNSTWADDARYYIGKIHEIIGDYITAKEQYEKLLLKYPSSTWADDARIGIGNCYYQTGVYLKAIDQYQTVIDKYAYSNLVPLAYYRIGWCHRRLEDYDESLLKFQQVITLFPESVYAPPAQYHIGEVYYELIDYEKSAAAFQAVIDNYPLAVWPGQTRLIAPCAYFYKGYCLEKLKKWEEAINAYQKVIEQYPDSTWEDGKSISQQSLERINYIKNRYLP